MPYSTNIIRLLDKLEPPIKEVLIATLEEIERQRRQWEESVTKTEFNELKEIVKELGKRVEELAEAQKRTEEELRKLISEQTRELGGLSHTVGYILEDRSYAALPHLLSKEFGIEVEEIKRDFVELAPNRYEELNIIGKGKKNGTRVWILGECKTQLRKKDVDSFLKKVSRIEHLFAGEKFLVMVTYQTSP